jgi:Rieske Fe-S protein
VWLQPLWRSGEDHEGNWIRVARLSVLPDDEVPRRFPVVTDRVNAWSRIPRQSVGAVFLRRQSGQEAVEAFSVVCPHAGCLVDYTSDEQSYLCPCHNSRFGLDGQVESEGSPSPRGLDSLETEVRYGDEIWVRYQSFRAGIEEKVPI